jgi:2-aminoadipate transaminase
VSEPTTTQAVPRKGVIDLALGHPAPELLPLELMRRACRDALAGSDASMLQYGLEQGSLGLRAVLADFLSERYDCEVRPRELFLSNGVSQALDLICTLFTRPGDRVFVEEPTYFLALRIFADHGLEVTGLPTDEEGLIPEAVERELESGVPAFLYLVPTFQNPRGKTLSEGRRERLAVLARERGFLLLADEVYHLLSYGTQPPPPLARLARRGGILSLGSFSKILAPGLRLGWVQGAPEPLARLARCGMLDSGGGLNPFVSAVVSVALRQGLVQKHLARVVEEYRSRSRALSEALRDSLPAGIEVPEPDGGFFLWLVLPPLRDAAQLLPQALSRGVSFVPGRVFSSARSFGNCLRLSFSYYGPDQLGEGARRLASALRESPGPS